MCWKILAENARSKRSTIAKECHNYVSQTQHCQLFDQEKFTTLPCVMFLLRGHWPYQSLQGGLGSTILILVCAIFSLSSELSCWWWYSTPEILSDKAWVGCVGCRKNLETENTKYTHQILIFFILFVDKTLWKVPLAFSSNTFEQKFWISIKRFTVTILFITNPLPSRHPNDTLKYVNAFEVHISERYLKYILRSIFYSLHSLAFGKDIHKHWDNHCQTSWLLVGRTWLLLRPRSAPCRLSTEQRTRWR